MPSQSATAAPAAWARLLAVLFSRAYRASLLVLAAVAIAPLLFGWGSFVIKSGSMEPSINVGDVVVARPFGAGETIAVGRVYVFDDPAAIEEHTLTHRIVEKLGDGTYVSAGDANEVTDFTPVAASDMKARGIVLAPYVGLPSAWIQAGEWVKLALWLLLTMAAFALATRNLDGEPPKWNLTRLFLAWRRSLKLARRADRREAPHASPAPEATGKVPAARRSVAVLGVLLAVLATGLGTANAKFVGQTRNSNWSFTVGQWAQPYVSAVLADSPQALWLLDEKAGTATAQDRSGNQFLGSYKPASVLGQAGGLPNNAGTSMSTTGGLALTSTYAAGSPTTHTIEFWFKSADQTGGILTGFGSSTTTGTPPEEDRVVRLTSTGRITYGDWTASPKVVITTPSSVAYDDNVWHHVVVASTASSLSRQTTVIYVDGAARISGQTSRIGTYNGYVRIGGGSGTAAFSGSIDNVSVYGTALSSSRVAAHWAAR